MSLVIGGKRDELSGFKSLWSSGFGMDILQNR